MRAEAQFHCGRQLRALPTNRQATFVCTAAYTPQPAVLLLRVILFFLLFFVGCLPHFGSPQSATRVCVCVAAGMGKFRQNNNNNKISFTQNCCVPQTHTHTAHVSVRFRFQWRIHTQQERTHSQNPHKAHSTVHTRHIIRLYETKIGKHTAQRHSAEHDVRNKNWNVYWTHTASKFTLCVVLSFDKWLRRTDTILANIGRFKRTHNTHKQHVLAKTESVSQSVTD